VNEDIEDSARLQQEINRDALIFWAVLVFTCVVGIIGLLPQIHSASLLSVSGVLQVCLAIIYLGLLIGMLFSIWRVVETYKENRMLALSGRLGKEIEKRAKETRTTIDKFIDCKRRRCVSVLVIVITFVFFVILYVAEIFA
jgi:nicotinamide riboside transporter PnuC